MTQGGKVLRISSSLSISSFDGFWKCWQMQCKHQEVRCSSGGRVLATSLSPLLQDDILDSNQNYGEGTMSHMLQNTSWCHFWVVQNNLHCNRIRTTECIECITRHKDENRNRQMKIATVAKKSSKKKPRKKIVPVGFFMTTVLNSHCDCKCESWQKQSYCCYSGKVGFKNEK